MNMATGTPTPGAVVNVRSANWKVFATDKIRNGYRRIRCSGLSGIVRGKTGQFVWELEPDARVLDPASIQLVPDESSGILDTKLSLAAAFRSTPTTTRKPLTLGKAAIDDLSFQHLPVEMALAQDRVRLLIADDVGLGKTLEAGLITSELALRGRAQRILVVTTRAMLSQFQKEFWTRFSIPLARLDSAAIRRMRNRIPAHYNVFEQFDRSIVSIDTLKKDGQIRAALEDAYWDLVIIDEAHNAADRARSTGTTALRAKLANLLSRRTDSLLLLTATPHDGSQESFASLIRMLDPTRIPDPSEVHRDDINDLVVRRFRSSQAVERDLGTVVPERELIRRSFPLSEPEERAYQAIADLELDLDAESGRGRAIDLFRTTLAKAIFSSPAACAETLNRRLKGIEQGTARGSAADRDRLQALANAVLSIDTAAFSKYQAFLKVLKEIGWRGSDPRDRLVIFSERIATVSWLAERIKADLGLSDEEIARIDGGSVEADVLTQKKLEEFGQERSPLRVLIASDMASEGLNLHFQCHRLIHFDLPWSLLRFQQRNGRIDRYGQDRHPQITYFVAESTHPKVRQMWVLEKLVEKDKAAQAGVGDPAVFLGAGDVEGEEREVAEAVAAGIGDEAFDAQMEKRAAEAQSHAGDAFDALFGEYAPAAEKKATSGEDSMGAPPQLFRDTFDYAAAMLERLGKPAEGLFNMTPKVDRTERHIEMKLPDDMRATDNLGYSREGTVDERYMPVEAIGPSETIELTDNAQMINHAIDAARSKERSWPEVQYLWSGHPILEWFAERTETFFPDHSAPVASLEGRMAPGEIAVILHGAIPNAVGAPVVDRWAVVVGGLDDEPRIEEVEAFIERTRLRDDTPNRGVTNLDPPQAFLPRAIDVFQDHLVKLRKAREVEIEADLNEVLDRLSRFEGRFRSQLSLKFGEIPDDPGELSSNQRRQLTLRRREEQKVDELFDDWTKWFERTRKMVADPNPYVDVKAVFVG